MADNGSRGFRGDAYARDGRSSEDADESDPLAELARLIGQSQTYGSGRRAAKTYDETTPLPELDRAAGDQHYAERDAGAGNDYDQYGDDRGGPPRYTPPAGFAEPQSEYASRLPPGSPSLSYVLPLTTGEERDAEPSHGRLAPVSASDNPRDDYDDHVGSSAPRRGTIIGLAILGVVVLGTAGAFGYHAMFGGSLIPSLPPIIKPGNTPVKIVPNQAQAAPVNQATVAKGAGAQLVPHQEQPVEVQAANPPSRVITTIPVISDTSVAPVPGGPPPGGPPPATAPALPAAPPPAAAQPIGPPDQLSGPASAARASGSKPVHTVIIKRQPAPQADSPAPTGTASAAGGPLSIVPSEESARRQQPPRTRTAMAHPEGPTPLSSLPAAEAATARSGGYSVQVSSQRSESEAEAAFRSLQAKFPRELGSRQAMFHRADLGAKGVYYRALVGPFASAEQASSLCKSLKAAGGSCLVQRN